MIASMLLLSFCEKEYYYFGREGKNHQLKSYLVQQMLICTSFYLQIFNAYNWDEQQVTLEKQIFYQLETEKNISKVLEERLWTKQR